jgi:hypothetical protein
MVRLSQMALSLSVLILLFSVAASVPASAEAILYASNSTGDIIQSFLNNETVYFTGNVTGPDQNVDVYIVAHQTNWANGTILFNLSLGYSVIQANSTGGIDPTLLWETPDVGSYDIIADVNRDAVYNSSIDLVDNVTVAGFTVLEAPKPTLTIVLGDHNPGSHDFDLNEDREHNVMMQVNISASEDYHITIESMAITAFGTGDEKEGVLVVYLVYDVNDDGIYDSGDALLSYSSYLRDDGAIFFDMGEGFVINADQTKAFIITYTMDTAGSLDDTFRFDLITVTGHGGPTNEPVVVNGLPLGSAVKTISNEVLGTTTTVPTTTTTTIGHECQTDAECGGTSCVDKVRTTDRCIFNSGSGLNECVETTVDVGCCYDEDCESDYYCINYECAKEQAGKFLGLDNLTWTAISIVVIVVAAVAIFLVIKNRKEGRPPKRTSGEEQDWDVLKKKWEENK